MKNIIRNSLVALVMLVIWGCAAKEELKAPPAETNEPEPPAGSLLWVIKPSINIRQENSAGSEKIGELADGDSAFVQHNQDGWYKIRTTDGKAGWVRSDLLAPRNISIFRKAVEFADRLKENRDIDLYFDQKLQQARVYLSFPASAYTSADAVEQTAREIITGYQNQVYRGDVDVHVLKPGNEDEYLSFEQKGQPNPDPVIPVIPYGRLVTVDDSDPNTIGLTVVLNEDVDQDRLLKAARKMVETYPISYRKVTITFLTPDQNCRLWFVEDSQGEMYKFDKCP